MLQGCLKNDRRAQELLYKQFYGPMMSICLRYTRNDEDALEVLHNSQYFRTIKFKLTLAI